MVILFLAFQVASAVPPHLSPKDSANLVGHVRDEEFHYIMDWRHEWESWRTEVAHDRELQAEELARLPALPIVRRPTGNCNPQTGAGIRFDLAQDQGNAHLVLAPVRATEFSLCPTWFSPVDTQPTNEALGIDNPLPPPYRDAVRAARVPLLALLDSSAHRLPGDAWIAGQRVRMHVDQQEPALALRAATECRMTIWWCGMLRGYVRYTTHDDVGAQAEFDAALGRMPPDTLCRWDDVSTLLNYSARVAYEKLSCADKVTATKRIWWLADPLYLVPGNARMVEHFARRVLGDLHAGNDIDEREDMRYDYGGPAEQEMVLRYGWPTTFLWVPPRKCAPRQPHVPPVCYYVTPPGWSRFDTKSTYLGLTNLENRPSRPSPEYWGPQYHTLPSWSAITDPLHAKASDWQLGPERQDTLIWDSSWWAPEFYQRYEGPLVDLSTQIAFLRRHSTAAIVAAMQWDMDPHILRPPAQAVVGVTTSGGPNERPRTVGVKMDGAHPRAIFTPVESRPLLLGVEVVPANDSGAAGRTRFGIAPPPPLSALVPGTLAISDPILARAGPGEDAPVSIQQTLPRMYGSTQLNNPSQLAVFWEVYGQRDHDTVDVALRIVRQGDAGAFRRAGARVGLSRASDDSLVVRWTEPRPTDPLAFVDSGVTVRPRSIMINISGLVSGEYTLEVTVDRAGASAVSSRREFTVVR